MRTADQAPTPFQPRSQKSQSIPAEAAPDTTDELERRLAALHERDQQFLADHLLRIDNLIYALDRLVTDAFMRSSFPEARQ